MSHLKLAIVATFVTGALVGAWGMQALHAQQPGLKRALLQRHDLGAPGREVVMSLVEFAPGLTAGRHTHPGEELGYVLEGTLVLEVEGRPPVTLKAGDAYFVEAGKIHDGKNTGGAPGRAVTVHIVEKGKPLAAPETAINPGYRGGGHG